MESMMLKIVSKLAELAPGCGGCISLRSPSADRYATEKKQKKERIRQPHLRWLAATAQISLTPNHCPGARPGHLVGWFCGRLVLDHVVKEGRVDVPFAREEDGQSRSASPAP